MACGDVCKMDFHLVTPGSVVITSITNISTESHCNQRGINRDAIIRRIESYTNNNPTPKGTPCPDGPIGPNGEPGPSPCPCNAARPSSFADVTDTSKTWKTTTTVPDYRGACKYLVKGTFRVKTKRVEGICDQSNEEHDIPEVAFLDDQSLFGHPDVVSLIAHYEATKQSHVTDSKEDSKQC